MGGIEHVERPFPAPAARLAVVAPQNGQRQQRPPHVGHIPALGQAVDGHAQGEQDEPLVLLLGQHGEQGQKRAHRAVIERNQHTGPGGDGLAKHIRPGHGQHRGGTHGGILGVGLALQAQERCTQQYGQRQREQDVQIQRLRAPERSAAQQLLRREHDLTGQTQAQHPPEVDPGLAGVYADVSHAEGEQREGDAPDPAQHRRLREQQQPGVVDDHGQRRQQLEYVLIH